MFGVGGSEIVIIGLIFLLIFGPSKLPQMARDVGKFVGEARRSINEFKDELTMEPDPDEKPARRRESRNGSKKSTKAAKPSQSFENKEDEELSDLPGDPEAAEGAEEAVSAESSEPSKSNSRAASKTNSQASKAKDDDEPELRDL